VFLQLGFLLHSLCASASCALQERICDHLMNQFKGKRPSTSSGDKGEPAAGDDDADSSSGSGGGDSDDGSSAAEDETVELKSERKASARPFVLSAAKQKLVEQRLASMLFPPRFVDSTVRRVFTQTGTKWPSSPYAYTFLCLNRLLQSARLADLLLHAGAILLARRAAGAFPPSLSFAVRLHL
jgi:hypothetical protein